MRQIPAGLEIDESEIGHCKDLVSFLMNLLMAGQEIQKATLDCHF